MSLTLLNAGPSVIGSIPTPSLISATIQTDGRTLTLVWNTIVSVVNFSSNAITLHTGLQSINCNSSSGSGTPILVYSAGNTILNGATVTINISGGTVQNSVAVSNNTLIGFPVTNLSNE